MARQVPLKEVVMRAKLVAAQVLFVAVLALVVATPAAAGAGGRSCKFVYADMETNWFPEEGVEMGWMAGTVEGGVYLKYDDAAPPVEPPVAKPNLVLSMKEGTIQLWVTGKSIVQDDGIVVRRLETLQAVGTGIYAGKRITVTVEGSHVPEKGGNYTLQGFICPLRPGSSS